MDSCNTVTRSVDAQCASTPVRNQTHRAARKYAEGGIPVGPCRHWPEKSPHWIEGILEHGFNSYTTDLATIDAFWKKFVDASIGMRLGEWRLRSEGGAIRAVTVVAVDIESVEGHGVDGFAGVRELEGRLGPLPRTRTNGTPSDGEHRLLTVMLPEGVDLKNLEGKDALAPGVELKVSGQILAPPSPGYRVKDKVRMAEMPRAWVTAWAEKSFSKKNRDDARGETWHPGVRVPVGERIPKGQRYFALRSECGRLHDGTRNVGQLIEDLDAINRERCDPPWERWEVERQARSISKLPPCRPQKPRELLELVEALSEAWLDGERKGVGAKNELRFVRLLIREGLRVGSVIPAGLRVEISFREVALALGCHLNTITNIVKRLKKRGLLRQDNKDRIGPQRGAFVLLDPRGGCDTPTDSSPPQREGSSSVTGASRKRTAAELETRHFRHGGPVGYSREDTLCIVEVYGPQTREELAERLGYGRARDLERLHLRPLVERGLLRLHGDLYVIPSDYRERSASARREPYSTVQPRRVRLRTPNGSVVVVVEQTGSVASEEERERVDRATYAAQRAKFRGEWEANLICAGERARSGRAEMRARHEERATSSHRTPTAAIGSPTTTEPRTRTPGCRRSDEGHRYYYYDGSPPRAEAAA